MIEEEGRNEQKPILQWLIIAFLAGANIGYAISKLVELAAR